MKLYFVILILSFSTRIFASSFYLTVEKSYTTKEFPKLRIDYQDKNVPLSVKILRPKNLDVFLDSQINISRSYEKPKVEKNPGYALAKGLNNVNSPFEKLRNLISSDFRKVAMQSGFSESLEKRNYLDIKSLPQKIVIKEPSGFEVVREFKVSLAQGAAQKDIVPGFGAYNEYSSSNEDDSSGMSGSYQVITAQLPKLPAGVYLIQAIQGTYEAQSILQVSDLSVQVKQSSKQILIHAVDINLNPISKATVSVRDSRNQWMTLSQKTDENGALFYNADSLLDSKLVVRVSDKESVALASTTFLSTQIATKQLFVMTDRPIFKPGDTFYYKGIIRQKENEKLLIPSFKRTDSIELVGTEGNVALNSAGKNINENGTFSGEMTLGSDVIPGLYSLIVHSKEQNYMGELRVKDYIKPTFYLELLNQKGIFYPGNKVDFEINAKRYSGGYAKDARFEFYLYRKKYESPQWVEEAGVGLKTGPDYFERKATPARSNQPTRIYSSVEARQSHAESESGSDENNEAMENSDEQKTVFVGSWKTAFSFNENGLGKFSIDVPKSNDKEESKQEWIYSLMVRAMDSQGAQAVLSKNYPVTLSEAYAALKFQNTVVEAGSNDIKVFVHATTPDGSSVYNAQGYVKFSLKNASQTSNLKSIPFKTDSQGNAIVVLPTLSDSGRLLAQAIVEKVDGKKMDNPSESENATLLVSNRTGKSIDDNDRVELYTDHTVVNPNDTVRIFALLPKDWGKNEKGIAWLTISGEKIFKHISQQLSGRSAWLEFPAEALFGSGFYVTLTVPMAGGVYSEHSIAIKEIQSANILSIAMNTEKAQAEPLKPFTLNFHVGDFQNKPAAGVELAVSVVDKAVYDVQTELRPSLFDFFYPLPQNNLMSFYSSDLQGYGYADRIRTPNFSLGALKAQTVLAKNEFRDTAGWFPSVFTDAKGNASVTVSMPANLTQWIVTAVAIDSQGRLGESKHTFRSSSDANVTSLLSSFMRENDSLEYSFRVANTSNQKANLLLSLNGDDGLSLQGKEENFVPLLPKQDFIKNILVTASAGEGQGSLAFSLIAKESSIRAGGQGRALIALKPSGIQKTFLLADNSTSENLNFTLPASAKPQFFEASISYGMMGSVLQGASWLASYPYGCTEQLISSTVPNLVLSDLLKRTKVDLKSFGPYSSLFERAKEHTQIGLKKVLENQNESGGFSLWKDGSPELYTTLVTLQGLAMAKDMGVKDLETPIENALNWFSTHRTNYNPNSNESLSSNEPYIMSVLAQFNILTPAEVEGYLKRVLEKGESSSIDNLVYALDIGTHYKGRNDAVTAFMASANLKEKLVPLLQNALKNINVKDYNKAEFLAYADYSSRQDQARFAMPAPQIISKAMALLFEQNALSEPLEKDMKKVLIQNMQRGYWNSSYVTAQVVYNLKNIIEKEIKEVKQISKSPLLAKNSKGNTFGEFTTIPGGFFLKTNLKNVTAESLKTVSLSSLPQDVFINAYVKAYVPNEDVKEEQNGIKLKREFFRLKEKNLEKLSNLSNLKVDDIIISTITVQRTEYRQEEQTPSRFLIVEDPIPSLAEDIDNDASYLSDAKKMNLLSSIKEVQRFSDKVNIVIELPFWNKNKIYTYSHMWRVKFKGKASLPASSAVDMYDETIFANTESQAEVLSQ